MKCEACRDMAAHLDETIGHAALQSQGRPRSNFRNPQDPSTENFVCRICGAKWRYEQPSRNALRGQWKAL
jgi:hypothetical protein